MLSRVANALYWMARFTERAENIARFIDVNLNLMLDLPDLPDQHQWLPLVITTGDRRYFEEKYGEPTQENVIQFLTLDPDYPNSILSSVRSARENARSVREAISSEMWEHTNSFCQFMNQASRTDGALEDPHRFFQEVKDKSQLLIGITDATMDHGKGWHYVRLGRLLERADKTSRILDVKYFMLLPQLDYVGSTLENLHWTAVLKSASALEMYRKKFHRITPVDVARFLVLDHTFPRAMHYCLIKGQDSLHAITGVPLGSYSNSAEKCLGRLRSHFTYLSIEEVIEQGMHEFLDNFQIQLNMAGDAIFTTFFEMRPIARSQNGSSQAQTMGRGALPLTRQRQPQEQTA